MPIVVKLELVFDTADEVLDLMEQVISPQPAHDLVQKGPQTSYASRVERAEVQARPLMDMLTAALVQKGMHPVRVQDAQIADKEDR